MNPSITGKGGENWGVYNRIEKLSDLSEIVYSQFQ